MTRTTKSIIETKIVRRIDDLGRIIIPKEIRQNLKIKEGDPLEIFTTTDGEVIFKPFKETTVSVEEVLDNFDKLSKDNQVEFAKKILEKFIKTP